MSSEEESELKELVVQTLESKGVLAHIRAQLRASVFLALEETNSDKIAKPLTNEQVKDHLFTRKGKIIAYLIQDFLKHYNMKSTLNVFEAESMFDQLNDCDLKQTVCKDLTINEQKDDSLLDIVIGKLIEKNEETDFSSLLTKDSSRINVLPPLTHNLRHQVFNKNHTDIEKLVDDPFFDEPIAKNLDDDYSKKSADTSTSSAKKGSSFNEKILLTSNSNLKKSEEQEDISEILKKEVLRESSFSNSKQKLNLIDDKLQDDPNEVHADEESEISTKRTLTSSKTFNDSGEEELHSSASIQSDCKSESTHSVEEENLSEIVDELLLSEEHCDDDNVTTDRTVSQMGDGADYVEDVE